MGVNNEYNTSWIRMLLRKGFEMDRGLGVIDLVELEELEEEEVVEGEREGEREEEGGRGWGVWMILGGRSVRAVGERGVGE